jgi:hypothetical protein
MFCYQLEFHLCSVRGPAKENWMKKSHNMPVWLDGFDPAFLQRMLRLVKGTAKRNTFCQLAT